MGKIYETIDGRIREFIDRQPVFFVATAPAGTEGHINLSPKGGQGTFAVLDQNRFAYLDYLGSGVETPAHLQENGRIVIMFCAFEGAPNIVRLHGTGRAVLPDDPDHDGLLRAFDGARTHGLRSIIEVAVTRISDSCGYGVPLMRHVGDRDLMERWAERKTDADLARYANQKNLNSIDGLPGLPRAVDLPPREAAGPVPATG
jgi:hypothetical protein